MTKQEFESISKNLLELKTLSNQDLIDMMDKLSTEFDETKTNIINMTYYLDNIEMMYNNIFNEFNSRKPQI